MNRRKFIRALPTLTSLLFSKAEAQKKEEQENKIILPTGLQASEGNVFIVGESWCRWTETIFEIVPISTLDAWFKLRMKQLDLRIKIYTLNARPENFFSKGTKSQAKEYKKLSDLMYELISSWEIYTCLEEAFQEDIARWFTLRELSLCGEESAIGVSKDRERAWMFYGWQAHWESNYREERIEQERKAAGW